MKKTFEFTEKQRDQIEWLLKSFKADNLRYDQAFNQLESIVSERITPEPETIKPYHEHGNSVASDRTESGQSAEDDKCETGCKVFTGGERRHLKECVYYPESFTEMYDDLKSDIDRLNESLTVMVSKNAELLESVERYKSFHSHELKTK